MTNARALVNRNAMTPLTDQEQRYLEQISEGPVSLRSRLLPWALEIVPGAAFFTYGVLTGRLFWEVFGFLSVVYFAVWRMYSQLRGRRLLLGIHDKMLNAQGGDDA